MKKTLLTLISILLFMPLLAQEDQASLLLELKKARASFEIARQYHENDKKLLENEAISQAEFNNSKNELLTREVDYQKLLLRLMSQQSYISIEKAIKYRTLTGEKRVKLTVRSTMEGNQDYLKQFEQHFDVFTPEMRSGKIYNIYLSIEIFRLFRSSFYKALLQLYKLRLDFLLTLE